MLSSLLVCSILLITKKAKIILIERTDQELFIIYENVCLKYFSHHIVSSTLGSM